MSCIRYICAASPCPRPSPTVHSVAGLGGKIPVVVGYEETDVISFNWK